MRLAVSMTSNDPVFVRQGTTKTVVRTTPIAKPLEWLTLTHGLAWTAVGITGTHQVKGKEDFSGPDDVAAEKAQRAEDDYVLSLLSEPVRQMVVDYAKLAARLK